MATFLVELPYWQKACDALKASDAKLAVLIGAGLKLDKAQQERSVLSAYATLFRAIIGQQISTKAANSIWQRFVDAFAELTPATIDVLADGDLRGLGLSPQKVKYIRDLTKCWQDGSLHPEAWPYWTDEAIIQDLVRVKGIGRWTAEMFLIFHLGRADVFALDDLGLQQAVVKLYGTAYQDKQKLAKLTATWAPWRTIASLHLWRSLANE